MSERSPIDTRVREVSPGDLQGIVEIDIKVLGKLRPEYWEMKLELVAKRPEISCLVGLAEGRLVGFIIGGASRWEYGVPENVGWIDTIGVDPDYQKRGVAKTLFQAMAGSLRQMGVDTINTFVTRRDWKLLKFFEGMGFQRGDMVNLELDI